MKQKEEMRRADPPKIDDQTIHFWHLQLQFMELHCSVLGRMFLNGRANGITKDNRYSNKVIKLANRAVYEGTLNEEERQCLATHLALQLSGMGE